MLAGAYGSDDEDPEDTDAASSDGEGWGGEDAEGCVDSDGTEDAGGDN